MAINRDRAARRKAARRYAKFSKKAQKKVEAPAIKAGKQGAYGIGRDKYQGKINPTTGDSYRSKTKRLIIGGRTPESRKEEIPSEPGEDLGIEVYRGGTGMKQEFVSDIPKGSKAPKDFDTWKGSGTGLRSDTDPLKRAREDSAKKSFESSGKSKTIRTQGDPKGTELDHRTREFGIKMPDKLVKARHKSTRNGKSKTRQVTKYFGEIPESEKEAAEKRRVGHEARSGEKGGRDAYADVKIRGKKIIEKRELSPKSTSKWDAAKAESEENRAAREEKRKASTSSYYKIPKRKRRRKRR